MISGLLLAGAWFYFNTEHIDLDATTRAGFDETFIELPSGVVHYELAGPEDGEMVVLVHGFSVPAYIWDPTFEFLVSAGYRVLRFDLYGRGHSDRPDGEYLANVYLMPQLASGQADDFKDKGRFPDWESRFREQMKYRGFRRAILSTIREWPGADILGEYEKLGNSGKPVHLFWGREDRTVPLDLSEKILERIPQARLTVIDGAGHLPHYELPETVNPLLLEQLKGTTETAFEVTMPMNFFR